MCGVGWGGMVTFLALAHTQVRCYAINEVGWGAGWRVEDEVTLRIHRGAHDMHLMFFK